jgi:beta-mannosidase
MTRSLMLDWQTGHHAAAGAEPERWAPAAVPGAVQLDWARAENWPPYREGNNFEQYGWMEDVYWTYRAAVPAVPLGPDERLFFVCGGVDYRFTVSVDGEIRHAQEGMFTPFEIDLTDIAARGGELRVSIAPVPKSVTQPADRAQANRSCKPAVSYGWDFHPRLIPSGIWQEAALEVRPRVHLTRAEVFCRLADDFQTACPAPRSRPERVRRREPPQPPLARFRPGGERRERHRDALAPGQTTVAQTVALENPDLWWPHDQGTPALYTSQTELLGADGAAVGEVRRRFGVRRVRLVMHPGAWNEPSGFPKSRSVPPITLEINGRRIFAKGANWVSPDIFPGTLTPERYREMLTLARDANMNLLRLWGGAIVQKEPFYDLCDELGILIWQEFPLACNLYPDDGDYLAVLDQESRSILRRLRPHPCVSLWCGGNELFNGWSGMTDQSLPLRLLNRNCYELAPETPFLMTSPVMGMGHGHYVFRDSGTGEEAWQLFQQAACTAYTEFGVAGPAPRQVLESFLPPGDLFPPRPGHGLGDPPRVRRVDAQQPPVPRCDRALLRPVRDPGRPDRARTASAIEGYKGLFEEARRQKPVASMALNWCLNEPWPTAANNSLISYPCVAKPALAAVGEACRPTLPAPGFASSPGRRARASTRSCGCSTTARVGSRRNAGAWLRTGDGTETRLLTWEYRRDPPNTNRRGPRSRSCCRQTRETASLCCCAAADAPRLDSAYTLVLEGAAKQQKEKAKAAP